MEAYAGRQFVVMDLHRRRSVLVRMTAGGEVLERVWIVNDPRPFGRGDCAGRGEPGGGTGGDLRLVLGGGCAAGPGRGVASGAPVGGRD